MKLKPEVKVGLFALITVVIVAYATIQVGDQSFVMGGAYNLEAVFTNVRGLNAKAPVELAGVPVGVVTSIALTPDGRARVILTFNKDIRLPQDSEALLKTRGFLGDTSVEVIPGNPALPLLKNGDTLTHTEVGGDLNTMMNRFNTIADDIEVVSSKMRHWTEQNEENLNSIARNLAELTENLNKIVRQGGDDVQSSMERIASITKKIDEGSGTLGKLVNDPATIEKLNSAVDNLNETLGGWNKMELGIGYHTEYLSASKEFKHYVSLDLKPSPDKAFLLEVVGDPSPDTKREKRISTITTGGVASTVTTDTEVLQRDSVQISAELAKSFYDLRLRGGMIESKGGLGLDYDMGPLTVSANAFDFETKFGEKPHLKFWGNLNLTENLYLVGGADDPLNRFQKTDYFVGAGFRLVDDDVKSLLKLGSFAK